MGIYGSTVVSAVGDTRAVIPNLPNGPKYIMHIIPVDTPGSGDVFTFIDRTGGGPDAVPPESYDFTKIILGSFNLSSFDGGKAAAPLWLPYTGTVVASSTTASTTKFIIITYEPLMTRV